MTPHKCETECREDLISKIECKVSKGSMFKITGVIVTIIIALWSIGYTIGSKDVERRETAIQINTKTIGQTREEVSAIAATLKSIEHSQATILRILREKKGYE